MTILRFPETTRTGDRPGGLAGESRLQEASAVPALSDARILWSLSALNRPLLDAVMGQRPRAQAVLSAFRAEWTPPGLRAPRPANDTSAG